MINFENLEKNNGLLDLYAVSEKVGIPQTRNQLIPGRFYSFKIKSPSPNLNMNIISEYTGGKYYIDLNPTGLVLFHENWREKLVMLNLKALPPVVSRKLLETYWEFSKLNGLAELFNQDGSIIDLEERRLLDKRFYLITATILKQLLGLNNINLAINKYNIDDIIMAKLIDWDQFGQLVNPRVSNFGIFPEGINLQVLYEDFISTNVID
jgi:hypothetical protein